MEFSLDEFLERHPPADARTNLDSIFSDPGRTGTLMEMPCNLPDPIIDDLKRHLDRVDFNRYPVDGIADLRARTAAWLDLPDSHTVLFGVGASEIIDLVMQYLGAGARALTLDPDFFMYRLAARKYGIDLDTHPLAADFAIDPIGLGRHIAAFRPDLIVLSNPHNPTSTWFRPEVIESILEQAPGLVLIDEVYAPFAPQPDACAALMGRYPNLIILRSFSKLGAAAIRFGFLAGQGDVLDGIGAWQTTFAVNSISAMIAGLIILHYDEIEKNVTRLTEARDSMIRELSGWRGVTVYPSGTNFIVVRLDGYDTRTIHERLVTEGVKAVLYAGDPALENCLRFSVDTPDSNSLAVEQFGLTLSC